MVDKDTMANFRTSKDYEKPEALSEFAKFLLRMVQYEWWN